VTKHKVHKYQKAKLKPSGKIIYKCILPGCPHYVFPEFVLNREAMCNECSDTFVMPHAVSSLISKPVCFSCAAKRKKGAVSIKKSTTLTSVEDFMKKIGIK
jgi:hypothetical protein